MTRHAFDPFSFVLGLVFALLGLFFLLGDRTAADLGPGWIWPVPVVVVGLLAILYGARALRPTREREPSDENGPGS